MTLDDDNDPIILGPQIEADIKAQLALPKKVTINDVARISAVSKKTVSRIINDAPSVSTPTRRYVAEIIQRLGFKPDPQARGLAFRKSFLIGMIYDNPNPQYVINMQMGVLDHLRDSGIELVVHPCLRSAPDLLDKIKDFIERQRLMGVILLPPIAEDRHLLALLDSNDVPYIRVTAKSGLTNTPPIHSAQILSLDRIGCRQAASHLVSLGHTHIGLIGGDPDYPSAYERRIGFEEGLRSEGLQLDPGLVKQGRYSFISGYECALELLNLKARPSAIFCLNDEMAAGLYKAAYELGLNIPQDLSVVSFDDSYLATRLSPELSTVRLPTREMAARATQALLDLEQNPMASHEFQSNLIVRGSSGPIKASVMALN